MVQNSSHLIIFLKKTYFALYFAVNYISLKILIYIFYLMKMHILQYFTHFLTSYFFRLGEKLGGGLITVLFSNLNQKYFQCNIHLY